MISIIIPIFNIEKYIVKCLDSILNQTYTDWELILVDDGSSDNSVACARNCLIEKGVSKYHIISISNQGVSIARNIGLEAARGEYIQFVDGDDWLEITHLEQMLASIADVDLAVCGVTEVYEDGQPSFEKKHYLEGEQTSNAFVRAIINGQEDGFVWRCLFKRSIIQQHKLHFLKDLPVFEDMLFLLEYLYKSTRVKFVSSLNYYYWKNNASALSRYNPKLITLPNLFQSLSTLLPSDDIELHKSLLQLKASFVTWIVGSNAQMVDYAQAKPIISAGRNCFQMSDIRNIDIKKLGKKKYIQFLLLMFSPYLFWKIKM